MRSSNRDESSICNAQGIINDTVQVIEELHISEHFDLFQKETNQPPCVNADLCVIPLLTLDQPRFKYGRPLRQTTASLAYLFRLPRRQF